MCENFWGFQGGGGEVGRTVSRRGPEGGLKWSGCSVRIWLWLRLPHSCHPEGGGGDPNIHTQNDPHDALIIWNIHNWRKKIYSEKILPISSGSHQPRSNLEVRSGVKFVCVFHPFLNSPQNSWDFECRHTG